MDDLTEIARFFLQQEAQIKGEEIDVSKINLFKVIHEDVDGDGQEEVCLVAGIHHPWSSVGDCILLDPSQDGQYVPTILSSMYGFRDLQVSDINKDGIPEIVLLDQSGSGAFLTLQICQWNGKTLKSLFPEGGFYQGFYETKDLDADGVDEVLIWQGEWTESLGGGPLRWKPKHFDIFIFYYNCQTGRYELQFSHSTERCYNPGDIVQRSYGGLIGQALEGGHRATSVNEYHQQLKVLIENQQVNENFVDELRGHRKVLVEEGFYEEALEITDLTLEAVKYLANPTIRNQFLIELSREKGMTFSFLGNYSGAVNSYLQALSFWTDNISTDPPVYYHRELGMMYLAMGDYRHALDSLSAEKTLLELLDISVEDNRAELSRLNSNFGLTYARMGEPDLAITSFQKAIDLDKELENKFGLVINYMGKGNVQRTLKNYQEAIHSYQAALRVLDKVSQRDLESDVYLELGSTLVLNDQPKEGLQYLQKALLLTSVRNLKQREAIHYLYLGEACRELNQLSLAVQFFQKAITFAEEFETPEIKWQSLYGLALTYQHQGQLTACQQALENAINTIEQLRSQYLPETFKISLFAEKGKLYEAMVLFCLSSTLEQAFNYMERGKSRAFIEQLATTEIVNAVGIPQKLAEQETQLLGELRCLQLRHRGTLSQQQYEWGDEITQIEEQLEQLWDEIRGTNAKGAEYVALRQGKTLDFAGVKSTLNTL
ncbi:MAG: tetratricopeptide repeat protein [Symploca sp. SIO2E9]|nr:tetratricopeptide repeat protein [Symploca sp. SIO2E9]